MVATHRSDVQRVLYVDDDPVSRRIFEQLGRSAQMAVDVCGSLDEAFAFARQQPYSVIAADYSLRRWDGLSVLRELSGLQAQASLMLVTDAMPIVGSDRDDFMLQGRRVTLRDGVCVDENGTLAGSAIDMATAVRNAVDLLAVPVEQAARMASTYPAQFLGLGSELGRIAPGYRANFTVLDDALVARAAWIDGTPGP